MQSFFGMRKPISCETAVSKVMDHRDLAQELPADASAPVRDEKSRPKMKRRSTTKKYVMTVGASGHVAGVESMQQKKKHSKNNEISRVSQFPLFNPWVLITKPLELLANRAQPLAEKKDPLNPSVASKTIWDAEIDNEKKAWDHASPESYNSNEARRKSHKAEKLSARHFSSSCAVERELFQVCLKDRFRTDQADCLDLREKWRQCQDHPGLQV
jgi:hypothetical protein